MCRPGEPCPNASANSSRLKELATKMIEALPDDVRPEEALMAAKDVYGSTAAAVMGLDSNDPAHKRLVDQFNATQTADLIAFGLTATVLRKRPQPAAAT